MRSADNSQTSARPVQPLDGQDMAALQKRMLTLADEIGELAVEVANARTVKEYDSDRRKRLLAGEMRQNLIDKQSVSSADAMARSSEDYGKGLDLLQSEYECAEHVLHVFEAKRIAFDACRTAISSLKTIAGNLG